MGLRQCEHILRLQHLSYIKARLFCLIENIFFQLKILLAKSGTSAATSDLMEPHWKIGLSKELRHSNWSSIPSVLPFCYFGYRLGS